MELQHMHLNTSNSSFFNSSNKTTAADWNQHVDKKSSCLPLGAFFSEKTFLAFFLLFLGWVLFSSSSNGFLFYLTVRFKQRLWQPQYILLKNISASGVGMTSVTAVFVLSSIVYNQTLIYGCWCIAQFSILRFFFLTTQMTLAAMAFERYIFICHAIDYLRVINTRNVYICVGLIWLVSGSVSLHGGLVLSQIKFGFHKPTTGLLCDAITIKEHITLSREDAMLVFVPPSVITTFCILSIFYCYGCMYNAALRVSMILKCKNHRANRTVGVYMLIFLLQLAFTLFFIVLTMMVERKTSCRMITSIVRPALMIIPSSINAVFHLTWNPQIKRLLSQNGQFTIRREVQSFQLSRRAHRIGENACPG